MFVYEKYDFSLFESRFSDYNRLDNYSGAGLKALFLYLEELAEDTEEPIEVDVIGLCCEFSEMSIEEACEQYQAENIDELAMSVGIIPVSEERIIVY